MSATLASLQTLLEIECNILALDGKAVWMWSSYVSKEQSICD